MDYVVYPQKNVSLELRKRMFEPTVEPKALEEISDSSKSGIIIILDGDTVDRNWQLATGEGFISTLETDEEYNVILSEKRSDGSQGKLIMLNSNDLDKNIALVPGEYTVDVISTIKMGSDYTRDSLLIPPRKGDNTDIDEVEINDSMYIGGVAINAGTTGNLIITPTDMVTKSSLIVFYASYDPDKLKYVEDMTVLTKVMESATNYPQWFMPFME
jgi:hypothetical protein